MQTRQTLNALNPERREFLRAVCLVGLTVSPIIAVGCSSKEDPLPELVGELKDRADELSGTLDDLDNAIEAFGDGYSNWQDVVPDVRSKFEDVKAAQQKLEDAVSSLDASLEGEE